MTLNNIINNVKNSKVKESDNKVKESVNKILQYEKKVFNEFIHKRTNLLKKIKDFKNKPEFKSEPEFVSVLHELSDHITAIKYNMIKEIDFDFDENKFILFYLYFKDIFFLTTNSSSELSEESELSDSVSDSDSVSESLVSESVSE